MTYSVDLFTGRNVFQKDYANVLQFDTPQARDDFFDSQDKITIQNTEFVHVSNDKTNITLTFTNTLTPEQQSQLDYAKFNYCRINYELVTESPLTSQQKSHYYFIDSYRIVSSATDRTVVRFNISEDIWTNYQFSVNFMPSLVERKHCNRWHVQTDGTRNKRFNIQPNRDRFTQINKISYRQISQFPKQTVKVCTGVNYSEPDPEHHHVTPVFEEMDVNLVWVLVSFTNTFNKAYDQQQFALIPIQADQSHFTPSHPQELEDYIRGQIQADGVQRSEISGTTNCIMDGSCFLSLAMLESQGAQLVLRDENDYAVTINSIQVIPTLPYESKYMYVGDEFRLLFNRDVFYLVEKSFWCEWTSGSGEHSGMAWRYFFKQYVTDSLERIETAVIQNNDIWLWADRLPSIQPTLPTYPTNGQFSQDAEPMMFFEPVMTRSLVTVDGQATTQIPDTMFEEMDHGLRNEFTVNVGVKFSASRCEMTYYLNVDPIQRYLVRLLQDAEQQIVGFTLKQKSYLFDILNDTYADYCVRQRDIDRRMMYMNILTGGIQESGSTAVSQGIGYRSNMERANKEDILNSYNTGELSATMRSDDLSNMYKGYQKSQAQMSQAGGLQAFGSNALGQTARYEQLQKQMINTSSIVSQIADWQDQVINNKLGVVYVETVCDDIQKQRYLETFTKYGYQVNSVQVPNLKTRKYFDYIKTGGQVLSTDLNQYIQSQLCLIFDNGVTLWHMDNCQTQDFILNHVYEYDNTERALTGEENIGGGI